MSNSQQTLNPRLSDFSDGDRVHSKEIDFVDILAHAWRSRLIIGSCLLLGLIVSLSVWFINQSNSTVTAENGDDWTARVNIVTSDKNRIPAFANQLENFVATDTGAHVFYSTLASSLGDPSFADEIWKKRQQEDKGVVRSVKVDGAGLMLSLRIKGHANADRVRRAFSDAIDATAKAYNEYFLQLRRKILSDRVDAQTRMSIIKLKALQLVEKHAKLSEPMRKTFAEGVVRELATTNRADVFTFILALVPDTEPEKAELTDEFKDQLQATEKLQGIDVVAQKPTAVDAFDTPIMTLEQATDVKQINSVSGHFLNHPTERLFLMLALGLLLGGALGFLIAMVRMMWELNKSKLNEAFRSIQF
jgi:hypothetical protein